MKTKLKLFVLISLAACVLVNECAAQGVETLFSNVAPAIGIMGSKPGSDQSSDADISKVVLAAPTTAEVFVANAKLAIQKLGYNITGINAFNDTPLILASKSEWKGIPGFGGHQNSSSVTISLGNDNRTINVSVTTRTIGRVRRGKAAETASEIAAQFSGQIQESYAAN